MVLAGLLAENSPQAGNAFLKRIAIGIPCLLRGGTEMQTLQLVKALLQTTSCGTREGGKSQGNLIPQVVVVCYFESAPDVASEFQALGAEVSLLNLQRKIRPWTFIRILCQKFRELGAEMIHIQYMAPGFLAVLAARLANRGRVVATVHQPWTRAHHGLAAKALLRGAALLCERFTCVSQAAEQSWFGSSWMPEVGAGAVGVATTGCRRHLTVYNAVDIAQVDLLVRRAQGRALRASLRLEHCTVVGAVSRLSRIKGIDVLLEAFAMLKREMGGRGGGPGPHDGGGCPDAGRPIVLVVVGDGEEQAALRSQASRLGLKGLDLCGQTLDRDTVAKGVEPDILWLGRRTWEESIELMSIFDICVVPSRFEGFGLTAAEAMACGKPVVASAVGGLPEVLGMDGEAGKLVALEDPFGMSQALLEFATKQGLASRIGIRARERTERLFSFERYGSVISWLYRTVFQSVC